MLFIIEKLGVDQMILKNPFLNALLFFLGGGLMKKNLFWEKIEQKLGFETFDQGRFEQTSLDLGSVHKIFPIISEYLKRYPR